MEPSFEYRVVQEKARGEAEVFERLVAEVACADRRKLLAVMQEGHITTDLYRRLLDRLHEVS